MHDYLPTISIVTPSYNQKAYLEEAITSVLDQNYLHLEYVVIDGGSTDGSVETIRRYADRLTYSVSEPDRGQYHAINKGFAHTSGEIMGWLNSDDRFFPWAFSVVGEVFARFPEVLWITSLYPAEWNDRGQATKASHFYESYNAISFAKGRYLPGEKHHVRSIQQESTFWRRSLWEQAGGQLDESLSLAADFDLWARFFRETDLTGIEALLGGFRIHGNQRSRLHREQYCAEAERVLEAFGRQKTGWAGEKARRLLMRSLAWAYPGKYRLKKLLTSRGILRPVEVIVYRDGDWAIEKRWVAA